MVTLVKILTGWTNGQLKYCNAGTANCVQFTLPINQTTNLSADKQSNQLVQNLTVIFEMVKNTTHTASIMLPS